MRAKNIALNICFSRILIGTSVVPEMHPAHSTCVAHQAATTLQFSEIILLRILQHEVYIMALRDVYRQLCVVCESLYVHNGGGAVGR